MEVCIMNSGASELTQRLISAVHNAAPDVKVASCDTRLELHQHLKPASTDMLAIIALVSNEDELQELQFLDDWPSKPKLLLVLPNNSPETIALGHRLRPTFVSYVWEDFTTIGNVIAHLRQKKIMDAEMGSSIFQHA
jgi:hypothetical protein